MAGTQIGNWTCPHCNHAQTVTAPNHYSETRLFELRAGRLGDLALTTDAISCANATCRDVTVTATLKSVELGPTGRVNKTTGIIGSWRMRPESGAKPQPEYIPAPLRQDYLEACRIATLSPKASATLSRRCLQGMIRDFCKITRGRLIDEINALRAAVDEGKAPPGVTIESVDGIDAVRQVGNIGAHMEKDISVIVDVDPNEAELLISLIEMLFKEWYVQQHVRTQRLQQLKALAAKKAEKPVKEEPKEDDSLPPAESAATS